MAQVHVHVGSTKPKPGLGKRFVRWCDRTLLSFVMGVVAFVLERLIVRSTKKAGAAASADGATASSG